MSEDEKIKADAAALADHIIQHPEALTSRFNESLVGRVMQTFGAAPVSVRPEDALVSMADGFRRQGEMLAADPQKATAGLDVDPAKLKQQYDIHRDVMCEKAAPLLAERLDSLRQQVDVAATKPELVQTGIQLEGLVKTATMFDQTCDSGLLARKSAPAVSSPRT